MTKQKKPGSHLYGRGFFGLIPLVGFFIGVGLIFLGAIKYRNRSLVLIGIAAMMPSILGYGFLFFDINSDWGRRGWSAFCKPQMDQVVKNIEFYKKEYKVYPDSLEQLQRDQEFLFISDPVQGIRNTRYGNNYYFRNQGTRYILFSMGVDGIPYTKDDIFPSIKYFDSTLTGLVKP